MKNLVYILCVLSLLACSRGNRSERAGRNARPTATTETRQTTRQPRNKTPDRESRPQIVAHTSNNGELSGADIFAKYNTAVFTVFTRDNYSMYQGSGFFISSDGLAVSNYHVFKGTQKGKAQIKTSDGSYIDVGDVVAYDDDDDIFIFKVQANRHNFNYIPISNKTVRVGEKAYAIGSPKGLENTFSSGEISQLREGYIQISVPIDHGSSGGVLLNSYGEAIGITTAGRDDSGANLNFAVDIQVLRKYIDIR